MTKLNGKATNPQDPLLRTAPERVNYLTKRFAEEANQFAMQDVINAAANLIITAMRQSHHTRQEAEIVYNEISGKMKQVLLDHYDSISGRKKGIFPYDQNISPGLVTNKSRIITN